MSQFWTANAIAQIAVSLVLLVGILMYIAVKDQNQGMANDGILV